MKIIIHNDNINTEIFDYEIKADINENIDKSLSEIVEELENLKDIETIYIKDNLSNNYLEFLGIRLAYHIRFSKKLKNIFLVIISELSYFVLNKLNYLSKIVITENTFLIKSSEIINFSIPHINFDFKHFLENIEIYPPKDYLSHHSITNEWAIDIWSRILNIETELIKKNKEKLEYMLYYKYLKAKFEKDFNVNLPKNYKTKEFYGKILLIDDKKEWGEVIKNYLDKFFPKVEFDFLGGFNRDISINKIEKLVENKIKEFDPDTIILDLRLLEKESEKIKEISGYKITKLIKKLNPSIQIILFTASKDSLILNAFFNQIIGYIQKDSPFEKYQIKSSFENFNEIIMRALKRKYLKKIWQITKNIKKLKFKNYFFAKEVKNNADLVFEILNSNMKDSFIYAVYQMIRILESISKELIYFDNQEKCCKFKIDNEILFHREENKPLQKNSLRLKIYETLQKLEIYDEEKKELICEFIEFRNRKIHGGTNQKSYCQKKIEKITHKILINFYEICFLILKRMENNV